MYASVGLHPHECSTIVSKYVWRRMNDLLVHPRCVALCEVGLDYKDHPSATERQRQQKNLGYLLQLAGNRPVVLHCREPSEGSTEAREDLLGSDTSWCQYLH